MIIVTLSQQAVARALYNN